MEAAGAVHAENEALRWLADLAGLPEGAGGTFVSGGSAANLSGLVAARHTHAATLNGRPGRWRIVAADDAHSSVWSAARIMDVEVVPVPSDERGRLTGRALKDALGSLRGRGCSPWSPPREP
jgi:glutamate/tyrosine decarboxylase-like PLP-dependent enzyme